VRWGASAREREDHDTRGEPARGIAAGKLGDFAFLSADPRIAAEWICSI